MSPKSSQDYIAAALGKIATMDVSPAHTELTAGNLYPVDVREQSELIETGILPGAIHIPRGLLEFQADSNSPFYNKQIKRGKKMLVYCGSGGRSALAVERLNEMGYDAVSMTGGFKAWITAGYDVEEFDK